MIDDTTDNKEPEVDADGRDVKTGRFVKGRWKGGKGAVRGYVKKLMLELVVQSMETRGDRIAMACTKGPDGEPIESGAQAYIDNLPDHIFVPNLVSKLMPKEITLDGDGEGGPVALNIIHYGHKPDEEPEKE